MKKGVVKYCVDVAMYITLSSIAAIGLLMEFVIPSGQAADKYFLGVHRHDWGELHFFLGLFFLILLAVHLTFNWPFILQSTKNHFDEKWQKALIGISAAWMAILFAAWILMKL
jgi:hypothetical protein